MGLKAKMILISPKVDFFLFLIRTPRGKEFEDETSIDNGIGKIHLCICDNVKVHVVRFIAVRIATGCAGRSIH